jgi:hypothetical protein
MTENNRRNVIPSSDPEGRELTAAETIWANFITAARHCAVVEGHGDTSPPTGPYPRIPQREDLATVGPKMQN